MILKNRVSFGILMNDWWSQMISKCWVIALIPFQAPKAPLLSPFPTRSATCSPWKMVFWKSGGKLFQTASCIDPVLCAYPLHGAKDLPCCRIQTVSLVQLGWTSGLKNLFQVSCVHGAESQITCLQKSAKWATTRSKSFSKMFQCLQAPAT